jgi:predicted HD phosphohydrolase
MTLRELVELLTEMESSPGEVAGLSELDHGLQCAYELSCVRPDDAELQVAGLVHDIGHQFASDEKHGSAGGARVREVLGGRVAALVEMHVPAKRYLVATDPAYRSALTDVSIESLGAQGGPLSSDEVDSFASRRYAADAVVLRRADDAAKVPGRSVPPLEHWLPILEEVAR